jgi:hypothetical protein
MPIRKVIRLRAAEETRLAVGVMNRVQVRRVVNRGIDEWIGSSDEEGSLCQYMNINVPCVTIDFLYYSGLARETTIYAVKNVGSRNQLNSFLLLHLPVGVRAV